MAPNRLGASTKALLLESSQELFVSSISTLEISRLVWGNKLELGLSVGDWMKRALNFSGAKTLVLGHSIAEETYLLPEPFHRDPADRILVASARNKGLMLITADERILSYPHVSTLDARK
jgi:PIN domain nuclease of toxin-antitoxin system